MRLALVLFALAGCTKEQPAPAAAVPIAVRLAAWDPVDAAFKGCEGGCGSRGEDPKAHLQPGASVGDLAYCPVSGVVFTVKAQSPRADVEGKPVFFCCDSCAAHFASNRTAVLAARASR